jgi:hypothetical protein
LTEQEAELLMAAVFRAAAVPCAEPVVTVVEIGSFCGKSTLALAWGLQALRSEKLRFYAIDPHADYFLAGGLDTFQEIERNLQSHGLAAGVEIVRQRSTEVSWNRPIALLFIDGLHDYEYVRADYLHFQEHVIDGGLIAFHDYVDYCPGVVAFVNELLSAGEATFIAQRDRLILLRNSV